MPVGEIFLSAFLQVLIDRLASRQLWEFARREGVHSKLKKWEKKLSMIQKLLNDAEEKQLTDTAVKSWLDDLQNLAYDVEDILDEFATEASGRRLMMEQHQASTSSKVRAWLNNLSPGALKFNIHMRSEIKNVTSRLEELRDDLGLKEITGGTSSNAAPRRPPSSSVPIEPAVLGRDGDKEQILERVLKNSPSDASFRVVAIVGMGGVGKTTLSREVYNDMAVDESFEFKGWACVSDDFDVLRISKAIFESITGSSCELKELNTVQNQLKQKVAGRKFLLVLDDVWSKDYGKWEMLKAPFMVGAPGSRIIVTTRLREVALTVSLSEPYQLDLLLNEDCWSVFCMHAFENGDIPADWNIQFIRQKVTEKSKGLPLAAKTLGGLLRSKQKEDEWLEILNSEIWNLMEEGENEIPIALKLSYHHLPPHLKRCFAYCAIFPKDYEFEEEELVLLWMAEGLIQQSTNNKQPEDLGGEYVNDLFSRSLFQQSSSNTSEFVMHDLVHDLAQWALGEISLRLDNEMGANKNPEELKNVRHFSYIVSIFEGNNKFEVLQKAVSSRARIRTFLPMGQYEHCRNYITNVIVSDLLPKLKTLRALSLRAYHIIELPNSIGSLKLLRYLNLSFTEIRSLPDSICSLYNLQILLLRDCHSLEKLPSNFRKLINLCHLDIRGAHLILEMPLGLEDLKSLRKLSNFIVGKNTGSTLKDLKSLKFLRGELCISRLNNVIDYDPSDLVLRDKKDLNELSLKWRYGFGDSCNEVVEENVLGMLKPHQNLQKLEIEGYGGTRFPAWVGDPLFSKMTVLRLYNCENCTSLPSLGLLSSLKDLTIKGMKNVKILGSEIYGVSCSKPFQSLETLNLIDLQELEHWEPIKENEYVGAFRCLGELSISRCPKLSGRLPDCFPSLEKLEIHECEQLEISISSLPVLCKLKINGCKGILVCNSPTDFKSLANIDCLQVMNGRFLGKPPQGQGLQTFISITELSIQNCSNLVSFPEVCLLSNLSKLQIIECHALTFIVRGQLPCSLKRLQIENCEKLECLWDDKEESCTSVVDEENSSNTCTSLLESLKVKSCPSLKRLSSSGHLPRMLRTLSVECVPELESIAERFRNNKSLEEIIIRSCDNLKSMPADLHNLNRLQKISIVDCGSIECLAEQEEGLPNTNLSELTIYDCKKLKALPNRFHSLNTLKSLKLRGCPSMSSSFLDEGFPTNLTSLEIDCEEVKIYKPLLEWGLHNLASLTSLQIYWLPEAESFPLQEIETRLPPSLTQLYISRFPNLKWLLGEGFRNLNSLESLNINDCQNLTSSLELALPSSLKHLLIRNCPAIFTCLPSSLLKLSINQCSEFRSFPEQGLPSSLLELSIWNCPELRSFPEQGLPSSLLELTIDYCPKLRTFPEQGPQSSLLKLSICNCPELRSFPEQGLPSSLLKLSIFNCPELRSFPEQGLPSSLLELRISNCPKLKEECKRGKGKKWTKISQIPYVLIDGRNIYYPKEEGR